MRRVADLVDFLLARIAEDEEAAKAPLTSPLSGTVQAGDPGADVVVAWDCRRVLAECEAKWMRVTALSGIAISPQRLPEWLPLDADAVRPTAVRSAVMLLAIEALPYADHPDYRDEWRLDNLPARQWAPIADDGDG